MPMSDILRMANPIIDESGAIPPLSGSGRGRGRSVSGPSMLDYIKGAWNANPLEAAREYLSDPESSVNAYLNSPDPEGYERSNLLPYAVTPKGVEWATPKLGRFLGNVGVDAAREGLAGLESADRVRKGEITPEQGAFDAALAVFGMGSVGGRVAPRGALTMFAGRGAKTADLDKMKMAQKMLDGGADRADVWKQTGWMRGPDGKMRFEIDDSAAALTARGAGDTAFDAADDLIQHQNLYDAYPDTRRTLTQFDAGDVPSGSYIEPESRAHLGLFDVDEQIKASGPDRKSTALHEMQHAIQNREGFSGGGSPRMATGSEAEQFESARRAYEMSAFGTGDVGGMSDAAILRELGIDVPDVPVRQWDELTRREQVEWLERGRMNDYKRLAGEAEARNVQTRMDMTPEQRLAEPPWTTLDVPEDDLIVRMGDGGPQMMADVWQGSPHKYGPEGASQSLKHIGKGEGAQAYGWGRYDAGAEAVGRDYQDKLAPKVNKLITDIRNPVEQSVVNEMEEYAAQAGWDDIAGMRSAVAGAMEEGGDNLLSAFDDMVGRGAIADVEIGNSYLYKHDLPDEDIARYLDWDKPLSEQPESVRAALESLKATPKDMGKMAAEKIRAMSEAPGIADWAKRDLLKDAEFFEQVDSARAIAGRLKQMPAEYGISPDSGLFKDFADDFNSFAKFSQFVPDMGTGGGAYSALIAKYGSDQAASEALGRAGIPGLKYYDGMSRNAGEGTRNYVTWDQDVLDRMKLLERNGETFAMGGSPEAYAMSTMLGGGNQQPKPDPGAMARWLADPRNM